MTKPRVIVLTGATATGKSRAALDLAHALEQKGLKPIIISADSVQVYKYMDIGSDKLPLEEREGVPHFMIDVAEPTDTFSAARFAEEAGEIIEQAPAEAVPIVVGGTGFYLRTLLWGLFPGPGREPAVRDRLYSEAGEKGLDLLYRRLRDTDPEAARRIHPHDHVRIVRALEVTELTGRNISSHFAGQPKPQMRYNALVIGLELDRARMYDKINRRAEWMMENGLVEEVKRLRAMGCGPEFESQQALGYRQVHMMLDGEIDRERALYLIKRDTRHFSRRQFTWLRKEPGLVWIPVENTGEVIERSLAHLGEGK